MTIYKVPMRKTERSGAWSRRWLLFLLAGLLLAPGALRAGKSLEDQALATAQKLFDDHQYNLVETNLSRFVSLYTNSPNWPYAVLYLARARFEQSNYDGAIQNLTGAAPQSGALADEYAFWIANAQFAKGEYTKAAAGFATLVKQFPGSPRQLEAAGNEAEAYAKIEDWPRVVALLQRPDSAFFKLAAQAGKNNLVTRGALLLGEALFAERKYGDGEKVVAGIDASALGPEWQWRRQYLLCRLDLAGGRGRSALQNSSNLLDNASGPRHQAKSRYLRGEIFESLGRTNEALQSFTNNLGPDLPAEDQRQALLKTVELNVAQDQISAAVQLLDSYVSLRTNGAALDLARLSLGELYLKIYYNPALAPAKTNDLATTATNVLLEALSNFDAVISNFPGSPLVARAWLDRGWCHWELTNMAAAREDFRKATDQLQPSPDQAVARFKLADAEFRQHDYGLAVSNYNLILKQYATVEVVTNGLFDRVLYQLVQANLARGDQNGATAALQEILDRYPNSLFSDRGELLLGQSNKYNYPMARQVFRDVLKRSTNPSLRAEAQYDIARTFEQEGNWAEALREYDDWVNRHASNEPALLPRVEYSRALVYGKEGMETKALGLFTNFVTRFPSNSLAPWAQNWVADYYFNLGDNPAAEKNYELLYQTFPTNAGDLPYQARLMAGRAALAGQRPVEAGQYFLDLVNNSNAPPHLVAQGWFALGETIFQQWQGNPTNGAYLDQAIKALSNLTNGAPTNAMAAQAYGRLGDYYMQWADTQWEPRHDPKVYNDATQMYQAVLNFPEANVDPAAHSEAEVALGRMAERQNKPTEALAHYCKVLYEMDPDRFDPFWIEQAGKAAAHLYESQQQWDKAIKVYQRVLQAVPSLRPALQKAINADLVETDRAKN